MRLNLLKREFLEDGYKQLTIYFHPADPLNPIANSIGLAIM